METGQFRILELSLQLALAIIVVFIAPAAKRFFEQNTTEKQREEALFWIKQVTKIAETLYKEHGQGILKEEYVINWLEKQGIKLNAAQLKILIKLVVDEYNAKGWNINE